MSNKITNLQKLDVPVESEFMKWLKRIAYIVTILTTLSGGILGFISFLREVRDPKAQAGYSEHSKMLEETSKNVRENREEIRFIYRSLVNLKENGIRLDNTVKLRESVLHDPPIQRPKKWKDLPIQQQMAR